MKRSCSSFPAFVVILALVTALSAGCKKNPPALETAPEPPPVQGTQPAADVTEEPMKPVIEEPAPARPMGADEYNRQRLLKAVYFDFDRYEIRPDQRPTLQSNADQLKRDPLSRFRVLIEGHCDERGTNEYNMTLGDRRANAVKQYLISLGVPASRLHTISYGEERPADPGHNEQAWARNRRSEFLLEEG